MLLTADIGNTNIVLALLDEKDRVVSQCRVPSGETLPPEGTRHWRARPPRKGP